MSLEQPGPTHPTAISPDDEMEAASTHVLRDVLGHRGGADFSWRWMEDEAEAEFWSEWFSAAPVDMTLGRLLDVWTADERPARREEDALPDAAVPLETLSDNLIRDRGDHSSLVPLLGEDTAARSATVLLQQLLDDAAGDGRVSVRLSFAARMPWLVVAAPLPAGTTASLLQAVDTLDAPALAAWLRAQVMLVSISSQNGMVAQHAHAHVQELVRAGAAANDSYIGIEQWQGLGLLASFTALESLGPAARTIGFTALRDEYEALSCNAATAVKVAWLEVLLRSASWQRGPAALRRLQEAERLCQSLIADYPLEMEGPRRLADVLVQRAQCEPSAEAEATLGRAARLAQFALARGGAPHAALTVAEVSLAQAACAAPDVARQLLEAALLHCVDAAGDPAFSSAAGRMRLAVERAFGQISDTPVPAVSAQVLDRQLQGGEHFSARDWENIAALQLQQGRFEQACQAAESASRQRTVTPALLATWDQASAAWHARRPQEQDRLRWRANIRAREFARLSLSL